MYAHDRSVFCVPCSVSNPWSNTEFELFRYSKSYCTVRAVCLTESGTHKPTQEVLCAVCWDIRIRLGSCTLCDVSLFSCTGVRTFSDNIDRNVVAAGFEYEESG